LSERWRIKQLAMGSPMAILLVCENVAKLETWMMDLYLADAAGVVAELKEMVRSIVVELEKQCPDMRSVSESCIADLQALDFSSWPQDELQRMAQLDEGVFGGLVRASA
jgi:hypothetical protein